MRGKKGHRHADPADRPRCRANKRRGRGTYRNDRLPVLGLVGRQSGQIRLEVCLDTKQATIAPEVEADAAQEAPETGGRFAGEGQRAEEDTLLATTAAQLVLVRDVGDHRPRHHDAGRRRYGADEARQQQDREQTAETQLSDHAPYSR